MPTLNFSCRHKNYQVYQVLSLFTDYR